MTLRVASKVYKNFDKPGRKYRDGTILRALARIDKCESQKEVDRYWDGLMSWLGPEGRFSIRMSVNLIELEERFSQNAPLQIQAQ